MRLRAAIAAFREETAKVKTSRGCRQLPLQWPCAIAMLALALSIPGRVRADARSAGLAGSLLIENRDDVYFFPQRTLVYNNQVDFSYGASSAAGNGLLTLGS